jgi:chloramphenicol-sensitive protein RarD
MKYNRHYAAAISAFLIWGFFPIPLRLIKAYPAGEILFFRILFSMIVLTVVIAGFRQKSWKLDWAHLISLTQKSRTQVVLLTLAGGALLSINWLTFIYIVNSVNIKTASFTYLICPVITAVMGNLILKERMVVMQWVAVSLCILSCVLIGLHSAPELGYSLLTAFSYAFYLISQRRNQGFDRLIVLGIQVLFALFTLSFMFNYLVIEIPSSSYFYFIIAIIAILFTVIPLFLNLYALNRINAAAIGILMYINPLLNFCLAIAVFGESVTLLQASGYSIILIALILFNYPNFQKIQSVARTQQLN